MNQLKAQEERSPTVEAHGTGQRSSGEQSREIKELHLAAWDVEDAGNPKNWSRLSKYWITLQLGMLAFAASVGSSITAPATSSIATYANISHEVSVLSISLYM
jgi:hypothetical protein